MSRLPGIVLDLAVTVFVAGSLFSQTFANDSPPSQPLAFEKDVARFDEFPAPDSGVDVAGELVEADHSNRRGGLRLDGDFDYRRYTYAPTFRFALLPYCEVYLHGAPASLADIPLGTHLRGRFLLPPKDEPPLVTFDEAESKLAQTYLPQHTYAYILEDDFSFYTRRDLAWEVEAVDLEKGKLSLSKVGAASAPSDKDFREESLKVDIDMATRVWKADKSGNLADISIGDIAQVNLGWAPGWSNRGFHCADIWLDRESQLIATERQRRVHVRHIRHFFVPAMIEHVEHLDGGRGIITVIPFSGMDPSLYEDICKENQLVYLAVAQRTLRLWRMDQYTQRGNVIEVNRSPAPAPGDSSYRLRIKMHPQLLEAYRPGRVVRIRHEDWPNPFHPREMRAEGFDP